MLERIKRWFGTMSWSGRIFLLFAVLFIICGPMYVRSLWIYHEGKAEYDRVAEMAVRDADAVTEPDGDSGAAASVQTEPSFSGEEAREGAGEMISEEMTGKQFPEDETSAEQAGDVLAALAETAPLSIDFASLLEVNPDTVAWIDFPGQDAGYPVVQTEDNDYYLTHTFEGEGSAVGAIFLDYRNQGLMNDGNTIIYGHNMRNGSMFGFLKNYQEREYYEQFPYFDIYTPERAYRCEIIACAKLKVETWHYRVQLRSREVRQAYTDLIREAAAYEIPYEPAPELPLVLLSTCTGSDHDYRFVILAQVRGYYAGAGGEG